jgi:hypothetical protein
MQRHPIARAFHGDRLIGERRQRLKTIESRGAVAADDNLTCVRCGTVDLDAKQPCLVRMNARQIEVRRNADEAETMGGATTCTMLLPARPPRFCKAHQRPCKVEHSVGKRQCWPTNLDQ